jgi:hypothetical protein
LGETLVETADEGLDEVGGLRGRDKVRSSAPSSPSSSGGLPGGAGEGLRQRRQVRPDSRCAARLLRPATGALPRFSFHSTMSRYTLLYLREPMRSN